MSQNVLVSSDRSSSHYDAPFTFFNCQSLSVKIVFPNLYYKINTTERDSHNKTIATTKQTMQENFQMYMRPNIYYRVSLKKGNIAIFV